VWLAERREPMVQRVALKIIKPGMDSKAVIARFEQERQALAVMDHPNVAKVFDGGVTPTGRPYFVMEHVQGEPITAFCDRHKYPIRARLELFIPVCEAVQHAHHKGIIHRDIKPSNVLVMLKDGHAIPKVIDFGVAKAMSHTLTDKTIFTERGQLIGTPEYMSPEQAEMGALDIDTRTDVFSLGVVLYEIVAGVLPFDSNELRAKGYDEICRIIRDIEPPTPSKKLTSIGSARCADIALKRQIAEDELKSELRGELEWIPLKAMSKARHERYFAPKELADDIALYLSGRMPKAGPQRVAPRMRKWFARHRKTTFVANTAIVVAVCGLLVGQAYSYVRKEAQLDALAGLRIIHQNIGIGLAIAADVAVHPPSDASEALSDPRLQVLAAMVEERADLVELDSYARTVAGFFAAYPNDRALWDAQSAVYATNTPDKTAVRRLLESWSESEWRVRAASVPAHFADRMRDARIESLRLSRRATLADMTEEWTERFDLAEANSALLGVLHGRVSDGEAVRAAALSRQKLAELEPVMYPRLAYLRGRSMIPTAVAAAMLLLVAPLALIGEGKLARYAGIAAALCIAAFAGCVGLVALVGTRDVSALLMWIIAIVGFSGVSFLACFASGKRWLLAWVVCLGLGCAVAAGSLIISPYRMQNLHRSIYPELDPLRPTGEP
jgi:serine/threonine protein kinase